MLWRIFKCTQFESPVRSNAKNVSRKSIAGYAHLKSIAHKLHLSGGAVDLLVGTDFVDAFIDIHTLSDDPGEPVSKRNCFGWYVLGQVDSGSNSMTEIRSVDVATLSAVEDIKKLVHQDLLGVTPESFVIKVPHENVNHSQPEWYMPLQAVFTPEKSTKVRLVFDSSSKGHDALSLNDHLEKGPNYINSLPNVLTAWHWDEYAYSGDIPNPNPNPKMFNQVLMHPDDQVFHRFLWRKNQHEPPPPCTSGLD